MKLMKQIERKKNKPTLMCLQSCDWKGGLNNVTKAPHTCIIQYTKHLELHLKSN